MPKPLSKTRTFNGESFTRSVGGSGKRKLTKTSAEEHSETARKAGHKTRTIFTKKHGYVVYRK